jgi:hypothetical protein
MRERARCISWRPATWTDYSGNLSSLITTIDLQQAQPAASKFSVYSPTGSFGIPDNTHGGYRLDGSGVEPRWRQETFSSLHQSRPALGPTQVTAAGAWRPPPTPSSTEVKKKWSFCSTPPLCLYGRSLRSAQRSSFSTVFVLIFFDFRRFLTK